MSQDIDDEATGPGGGLLRRDLSDQPTEEPNGRAERSRSKQATIGDSFSPTRNSLNFIRLVLAITVVISHAILLGGFGVGDIFNQPTDLGTAAVYGFFGISGFLIAGSALRNGFGRYLWQRFLRIFPGFWVCLVITAFFIGAIAWMTTPHPVPHACGLGCYLKAPQGPFEYVYRNFLLLMQQSTISNTPSNGQWNGSLWTLFYEFLCYLLLGGLALLRFLRHRVLVAWLTLGIWIVAAIRTFDTHLFGNFTVMTLAQRYFSNRETDVNFIAMKLLTFASIFLVGSLLFLYKNKIPDSGFIALACTGIFALGIWLPFGGRIGFWSMTSADLLAPAIAYPLLWLGIHLPFHRLGAHNDYSYGVYIYAYPVQQLLAEWHVPLWGYFPYLVLSLLGLAPLAVASWWIVEKPALSLKRFQLNRRASPLPSRPPGTG